VSQGGRAADRLLRVLVGDVTGAAAVLLEMRSRLVIRTIGHNFPCWRCCCQACRSATRVTEPRAGEIR
jgi:hypothetical protein